MLTVLVYTSPPAAGSARLSLKVFAMISLTLRLSASLRFHVSSLSVSASLSFPFKSWILYPKR